jgi:hypothetical protein
MNHRPRLILSLLALLATALVAIGSTVTPATASTNPDPGGGGCNAYVSSMSKSGTTVIGVFTIRCESYMNFIQATGLITRGPLSNSTLVAHRSGNCYGCKTLNVTVKAKNDPAGSQQYGFTFDGSGTTAGFQPGSNGNAGQAPDGGSTYNCQQMRCFYQLYRRNF